MSSILKVCLIYEILGVTSNLVQIPWKLFITNEFLKQLSYELIIFLTLTYNTKLRLSYISPIWKFECNSDTQTRKT